MGKPQIWGGGDREEARGASRAGPGREGRKQTLEGISIHNQMKNIWRCGPQQQATFSNQAAVWGGSGFNSRMTQTRVSAKVIFVVIVPLGLPMRLVGACRKESVMLKLSLLFLVWG